VDWDTLTNIFDEFETSCDRADTDRLLQLLTTLVPENRINVTSGF
jgi:hypothetical protein